MVPTPTENPQQNAIFDKRGRYCRKKPCNLDAREIAQKIHNLLSFYRIRCQPGPAMGGILTQISGGPKYRDPVSEKYRDLPKGAICALEEGSRYGNRQALSGIKRIG